MELYPQASTVNLFLRDPLAFRFVASAETGIRDPGLTSRMLSTPNDCARDLAFQVLADALLKASSSLHPTLSRWEDTP
jgi:hypothetical protein